MLTENIATDTRAAALFRNYIRRKSTSMSPEEREKLKGFRMCGSRVIHQMGAQPAVFVVRVSYDNHADTSHFFGNAYCKSTWACPYCTARIMAERSTRIAAAIDALDAQNQYSIMFTFTMPHLAFMSCEESFQILKAAWRHFVRGANHGYETRKHKLNDGTVTTYKIRKSEYGVLREELNIRHCVRVYEFTHGRNGWHPHIHMLVWIPKENFSKVTDYEANLNKAWMHALRFKAKQYWREHYPDLDDAAIEARLQTVFSFSSNHAGLKISKNPDGTPRRTTSAQYISGWKAHEELTRTDLKKANKGHYTPHQIIDKAIAAKTAEERDKWLALYAEYALATKGSRRIEISNSGLNKIIDAWLAEHPHVQYIEKKTMANPTAATMVCWFNENQWWFICNCIEPEVYDIRAQILERARLPDGKSQIEQLLLGYGLDIRDNGEHSLNSLICSIYCKAVA